MRQDTSNFVAQCVVGACVIAFMAFVTCNATGDTAQATHVLAEAGWSDVAVEHSGVAWGWEGCAKGDSVFYEARGTNPAGKPARALVCCGAIVKACTVRFR
jgi:hypothetical protein